VRPEAKNKQREGVNMPKQHIAGHLKVGTTRLNGGKLIDEWTFASPFQRGDKAPAGMTVQIFLQKSEQAGVSFCARGPGLPQELVRCDIEQLRQSVEAALRLQHDLATNVCWETWLEVRVDGGTTAHASEQRTQSELRVQYTPIQRGVDQATGVAYVLTVNGTAALFPLPKKVGEPDVPVPGDKWTLGLRDRESEYAYLPASAGNIAALDELISRMEGLRTALSQLLRHDTIAVALASLAPGLPTLAPPG
jgi:hypothetical protein